MNYYSHHIGDYTTDTAHLSILEDGAYRRLMDRYYTTESPLSIDEPALFRVIRARSEDEKEAVRVVLNEFFTLTDAGWTHKRCDAEIAAFHDKSEKTSRAANKRWGKPASDNASQDSGHKSPANNADALQMQSESNADAMLTNNQQPVTNNQEPKKKTKAPAAPAYDPRPDLAAYGVDEQIAADWLALRKSKRATVTRTALSAIVAESGKAGIPLGSALALCCQRGWTGFEAEWIQRDTRAAPGGSATKFDPTAYVNRNRTRSQP